MFDRQQSIRRAVAATLSDSTNNKEPTRSVFCNAAGTIRVVLADNTSSTVDYVVQASQRLPISAVRVNTTGTTVAAANIILEY
jgi:hypothetical protein